MTRKGQPFTTPAVLIRRATCGESDVVATFFSLEKGKVTCFAPAARASRKRFAAGLDLFDVVEITGRTAARGGLPLIEESSLRRPFEGIRGHILKTAYASYWCELLERWTEPGTPAPALFDLLVKSLVRLDAEEEPPGAASLLFQIHLLRQIGLSPDLSRCGGCGRGIQACPENAAGFDLEKGRALCHNCRTRFSHVLGVSRGTLLELDWVQHHAISIGQRMRFTRNGLHEGLRLLEAFTPHHMGCQPRSLVFLRQVRSETDFLTQSASCECPGKIGP